MAETLTVRLRIEGARGTLAAFRELPREASAELRDATRALVDTLAGRVRSAALADSEQTALMAPTVAARRDRVPVIVAGGARRVGRNRAPAHKILFGSEFGSKLPQFRPHQGRGSYWFFRTVERSNDDIARSWMAVADEVLQRWAAVADGAPQ